MGDVSEAMEVEAAGGDDCPMIPSSLNIFSDCSSGGVVGGVIKGLEAEFVLFFSELLLPGKKFIKFAGILTAHDFSWDFAGVPAVAEGVATGAAVASSGAEKRSAPLMGDDCEELDEFEEEESVDDIDASEQFEEEEQVENAPDERRRGSALHFEVSFTAGIRHGSPT